MLVGKKIAIVTHGVPPKVLGGGVEENVRQHALRLMEMGAEVFIIGGTGGGELHPQIKTTVRHEYANIANKAAGEGALKKLLKYGKKLRKI